MFYVTEKGALLECETVFLLVNNMGNVDVFKLREKYPGFVCYITALLLVSTFGAMKSQLALCFFPFPVKVGACFRSDLNHTVQTISVALVTEASKLDIC